MAVYNKFYRFSQDVLEGKHNFSSDVFKLLLTNTGPLATNSVKANLAEIAAGNGYAAGGPAVTITLTQVSGLSRVSALNHVITAAGGSIGPFQYVALYNSTSATQPLVSWWDYGSVITLLNTETFTINFDAVNGILDIQ